LKKIVSMAVLALILLSFVSFSGCGTKKQAQTDTTKKAKPAVKKVTVGDIQVGYRVYGKGHPLVMVMGYGGTQDIWDPTVIDMLSQGDKHGERCSSGEAAPALAQSTIMKERIGSLARHI